MNNGCILYSVCSISSVAYRDSFWKFWGSFLACVWLFIYRNQMRVTHQKSLPTIPIPYHVVDVWGLFGIDVNNKNNMISNIVHVWDDLNLTSAFFHPSAISDDLCSDFRYQSLSYPCGYMIMKKSWQWTPTLHVGREVSTDCIHPLSTDIVWMSS